MIQPTIQEHSHTGLYTTVTLSLATAAILMIVVLSMLTKKPIPYQPQTQTLQYQPQENQTQAQMQQPSSVQTQVQQLTPMPIQTPQNLQAIAQTLDSTNMTQITTGLDQNSQDTSSFSQ